MVKHGELQKRILKMVSQFMPCEERAVDDKNIEFSLLLHPFTKDFCTFAVEKFKKMDSIRLVCILNTSPKIQSTMKKLSKEDRQATMEIFTKLYQQQYKTDYIFSKDYKSIQNMKWFLTQNLSLQSLLDAILSNIMLAREAVKYLIEMDKGMESAEIDSNNTMYS